VSLLAHAKPPVWCARHERRSPSFSYFGRIGQGNFHGAFPEPIGSHLPKTIYTKKHERLRELLRAERKRAGLTQTVVAERLGKPPSYVAKYEGGDRRLDVLEFLDVAEAIGFDPYRFIRSLVRR
jgi:hypothetical protein